MNPKKNIAIFGGTFDPPHKAHLLLLKAVQKQKSFQKIWIVPSKNSPGKKTVAPFEKRLVWVQLLFSKSPFQVSGLENTWDRDVFGIDIFNFLKKSEPAGTAFTWILGEDQFQELSHWNLITEYGYKLHWLVLKRHSPEATNTILRSRRIKNITLSYEWAQTHRMNISSSQIRKNIQEGKDDSSIPTSIRKDVIQFYRKENWH